MRKLNLIFAFGLLLISNLSSGQSATVRGMYLKTFNTILGNTVKEDSVLQYAQANAYNYVCMYNLPGMNFTTNTTNRTNLANFISRGKTIYGITSFGASGENAAFFTDQVLYYNNSRTTSNEKIDIFNFEFEFWNQNSITSLYCSRYLTPKGYACDTSGAFKFAYPEFKKIDSVAAANGASSELYLGWPNAGQMKKMVLIADRILLHAYRTTDADVFAYSRNRLIDAASLNITVNIIPIFSSESSFMGPWLTSNHFTKAYNSYINSYRLETGTWKQYINIKGYHWFTYVTMIKTTKAGIITASGPTTFCTGGNVTLTAPAGASYLWSPGGQTTRTLTVTASGDYSVKVNNTSGVATYTPAVSVTAGGTLGIPVITASGPLAMCTGQTVTLTSSSATGNLWSTGATTQSITVSTSGTYWVRITSGTCTAQSLNSVVTVGSSLATPTISTSGPTALCNGSTVTLTSSSTSNNTWSTGATTRSITVSTAGTYWVRVSNGSCTAQSSNTVVTSSSSSGTVPTISATGSTTICPNGGSVTLTSSTASSYLWSTGETTRSIVATEAGSYTVTTNTGSGCGATSDDARVYYKTAVATPTITASGSLNLASGGSVTLTSSTNTGYLWTTGATTRSITVSSAGSYRVTTTGSNGCTATSNATAVTTSTCTPPAVPTVTTSGNTTIVSGQSVTLTSTTGSGYLWSNGATTRSITVTAAGSYTVRVYSSGSCYSTSLPTVVYVVSARTVQANETENPLSDLDLKAYPNPVRNELNVTFTSVSNTEATILIYDMNGREVLNRRIDITEGFNNTLFDVSMFSKGMYMLNLMTGNQKETLRFVKD